MKTVAIVGVGLIGGSFALALRKAGFDGRIIGVSSPRTIAEALRLKVIDEAQPLAEAAGQSDLIYLAQPIVRILDILKTLDPLVKPGALVTDAGSTKRTIAEQARESLKRAQFLGGHPMAGKESRGVAAAEADLFAGRPYVLTPWHTADLDTDAAVEHQQWIRKIGARLVTMDPASHDRAVALASHLPQLASTALASALSARAEAGQIGEVAGPGLIDSTRLALSPYDVWSDIFATNTDEVDQALAAYIDELKALRSELSATALEDRFTSAASFAKSLRDRS